nr:hypothetical protein [Tanacetum cinerariifolium]
MASKWWKNTLANMNDKVFVCWTRSKCYKKVTENKDNTPFEDSLIHYQALSVCFDLTRKARAIVDTILMVHTVVDEKGYLGLLIKSGYCLLKSIVESCEFQTAQ